MTRVSPPPSLMETPTNAERGQVAFDAAVAQRVEELLEAQRVLPAQRSLDTRLRASRLPERERAECCLEAVRYEGGTRGFDAISLARLADCAWVQKGEPLVITGDTGRGKTWLACAFANEALRRGYKVRYDRVPELLRTSWKKVLGEVDDWEKWHKSLDTADVWVLDDWGAQPLAPEDIINLRNLLIGRLSRRKRSAMIVASPLALPAQWEQWLGGQYMAKSIVDRLIHGPCPLSLAGPSLR